MYAETIENFAKIAETKVRIIKQSPATFFTGAMMAGAYIGLGIILIFTLGASVDPSLRKLVMGGTFGIALTLVIFAGAELFTGLTMFTTFGWLRKKISLRGAASAWVMSWIGNLAGAALLAIVFYVGGGGALLGSGADLLNGVAGAKMNKPVIELLALGILCNWLVCLAIWMAARTQNDAAKAIVIFWCLLAFVASGYEHSIANMTIFLIALLGNHPETVSFSGMAHNLLWVTIGNGISGVVFMGLGYWHATPKESMDPLVAVGEAAE